MNDKKKDKKQHKKYRPINCESEQCNGVIDIDYAISVDDFDYCDSSKSSIYVYCPKCALQHTFKL